MSDSLGGIFATPYLRDVHERIAALEAENARLREALRPFADLDYSYVSRFDFERQSKIVFAYRVRTSAVLAARDALGIASEHGRSE